MVARYGRCANAKLFTVAQEIRGRGCMNDGRIIRLKKGCWHMQKIKLLDLSFQKITYGNLLMLH